MYRPSGKRAKTYAGRVSTNARWFTLRVMGKIYQSSDFLYYQTAFAVFSYARPSVTWTYKITNSNLTKLRFSCLIEPLSLLFRIINETALNVRHRCSVLDSISLCFVAEIIRWPTLNDIGLNRTAPSCCCVLRYCSGQVGSGQVAIFWSRDNTIYRDIVMAQSKYGDRGGHCWTVRAIVHPDRDDRRTKKIAQRK